MSQNQFEENMKPVSMHFEQQFFMKKRNVQVHHPMDLLA